jgi:hypothetical protein
MFDIQQANILFEDFLNENKVEFEKDESAYMFKALGDNNNSCIVKLVIEHKIVSLYSPIDTNEFDNSKVPILLDYIVNVNNILSIGSLQYLPEMQYFNYKISNIVLHSEHVVDIIHSSIGCILCFTKVLTTVLNQIITKNIDSISAINLTQEYLIAEAIDLEASVN